jgi:hypothetical protein
MKSVEERRLGRSNANLAWAASGVLRDTAVPRNSEPSINPR